jgi:hypothetical protein
MAALKLSIAKDFSAFPAGRYVADGPYPGERFREVLVARLNAGEKLIVDLDGTMGYGSSFLEEAFGGLVRKCGFSARDLHARLEFRASDESLVGEVWSYIDSAKPES